MTNNDVITDALRLLGVVAVAQNASPEDAELGLRVMNEMLAEWADQGLSVNHARQDDVNAESPLLDSEVMAVKYNLAFLLAPHFGRDPSGVAGMADRYYTRLLRQQMARNVEPVELSLPATSGRYDIFTDS